KFDALTRSNKNLLHRVKLILIDEVHILGESRGATLEASISRIRRLQKEVRLVAMSATIGNIKDIADWLSDSHGMPAASLSFNESSRSIPVNIHIEEFHTSSNPFSFEIG